MCVIYSEKEMIIYIYPLFSSCSSRNDLAEVLALLKTQIDPALLKKDEEAKLAGEEGKTEDGKVLTSK